MLIFFSVYISCLFVCFRRAFLFYFFLIHGSFSNSLLLEMVWTEPEDSEWEQRKLYYVYFHTISDSIYGYTTSDLTTVHWCTHTIYSQWISKIRSNYLCNWTFLIYSIFSKLAFECIHLNGKIQEVDISKQSSFIAKHSLTDLLTLRLLLLTQDKILLIKAVSTWQ